MSTWSPVEPLVLITRGQPDVVAQRLHCPGDRDDVGERRVLGIEVEDAPVGRLERRHAADDQTCSGIAAMLAM